MTDIYKQYDRVVEQVKLGQMSRDEALETIGRIEENAYESMPDAEPDGDITYGASLAMEEVYKLTGGMPK